MARVEVDLIVEAIAKGFDKVERGLSNVADDASRAGDELEKAGKSSSVLDVALGNLVAGGLQAAGTAMIDFAKASIDVASSAQETAGLIDNSLGPAAEGFRETIDAMAEATGRSSVELQAGASTIIAMTKSMGFANEEASTFSSTFAQVATDLGSFFNQSTGQVFEDLQSAMAGSAETMLKYGIDVKVTALEAAALEMGLIQVGEKMDRVTRATVLQAEVMRQAADEMGDAERTSGSYENSSRALQAAALDLQVALGEALLPVLTQLTQQALPAVKAATEDLAPAFEEMGSGFLKQVTLMSQTAKLSKTSKELRTLGLSFAQVNDILGDGRGRWDLWRTAKEKASDVAAAQRGIDRVAIALELMNSELEISEEQLIAMVAARSRDTEAANAMTAAYADLVMASEDATDAIEESTDAIEEQAEAAQATAERVTFMGSAFRDAGQATDGYEVSAERLREIKDAALQAAENAAIFQAKVDDVKNAMLGITEVAPEVSTAWGQMWSDANKVKEEVEEMNAELDRLQNREDIRVVIDSAAAEMNIRRLIGLADNLAERLAGAGGPGDNGPSPTGGTAAPGATGRGGDQRAGGGSVTAGRQYTVGEFGPELFTPDNNGFITSNGNLRGGGGGASQTNIYITPPPVGGNARTFGKRLAESYNEQIARGAGG